MASIAALITLRATSLFTCWACTEPHSIFVPISHLELLTVWIPLTQPHQKFGLSFYRYCLFHTISTEEFIYIKAVDKIVCSPW